MSDLKIAVVGCKGRMGQALTRQIIHTPGTQFAGGVEVLGSPSVGRPILDPETGADTGFIVGDNPDGLFGGADAVVDFTTPMASTHHAKLAEAHGTILVIGTTGMDRHEQAEIDRAARKAVIVQAGNMSLGVNLMVALTRDVARRLGPDWDIEIVEMHHRNKVDAPSGTALMLGAGAADGRGIDLASHSERGRDGMTGARGDGTIGFASLRGGSVVGEHKVIFASDNERLELIHRADDRSIFARGAVHAALWARDRDAGLYTMTDVLDL